MKNKIISFNHVATATELLDAIHYEIDLYHAEMKGLRDPYNPYPVFVNFSNNLTQEQVDVLQEEFRCIRSPLWETKYISNPFSKLKTGSISRPTSGIDLVNIATYDLEELFSKGSAYPPDSTMVGMTYDNIFHYRLTKIPGMEPIPYLNDEYFEKEPSKLMVKDLRNAWNKGIIGNMRTKMYVGYDSILDYPKSLMQLIRLRDTPDSYVNRKCKELGINGCFISCNSASGVKVINLDEIPVKASDFSFSTTKFIKDLIKLRKLIFANKEIKKGNDVEIIPIKVNVKEHRHHISKAYTHMRNLLPRLNEFYRVMDQKFHEATLSGRNNGYVAPNTPYYQDSEPGLSILINFNKFPITDKNRDDVYRHILNNPDFKVLNKEYDFSKSKLIYSPVTEYGLVSMFSPYRSILNRIKETLITDHTIPSIEAIYYNKLHKFVSEYPMREEIEQLISGSKEPNICEYRRIIRRNIASSFPRQHVDRFADALLKLLFTHCDQSQFSAAEIDKILFTSEQSVYVSDDDDSTDELVFLESPRSHTRIFRTIQKFCQENLMLYKKALLIIFLEKDKKSTYIQKFLTLRNSLPYYGSDTILGRSQTENYLISNILRNPDIDCNFKPYSKKFFILHQPVLLQNVQERIESLIGTVPKESSVVYNNGGRHYSMRDDDLDESSPKTIKLIEEISEYLRQDEENSMFQFNIYRNSKRSPLATLASNDGIIHLISREDDLFRKVYGEPFAQPLINHSISSEYEKDSGWVPTGTDVVQYGDNITNTYSNILNNLK